ncbi:MAG TPA: glycosyltransferase family 4 protein [Terriglobales bacterium]|nr:glycosyltransferase family 4 protein [Terriglobales bacterium]
MKICFLADARSPIAKNWISYFVHGGHEVSVISSYASSANEISGAQIFELPLGVASALPGSAALRAFDSKIVRNANRLRQGLPKRWNLQVVTLFGLQDVRRKTAQAAAIIDRIRPDLVHAMRLPFEGLLASQAVRDRPLIISTWGNDFTLFSSHFGKINQLTRAALGRTDAIHCDCRRDLRLAIDLGFSPMKPSRVLPGGGGIQTSFYFDLPLDPSLLSRFGILADAPLVVNPRGFRGYVRQDTFFRSVPQVLQIVPRTIFLCVDMQENAIAKSWVRKLSISNSVRLLPRLSREELAMLFRASEVSVSPSLHDGTPNTLLESMAAGAFPIAGDLDSIREWIADGENGLLFDPREPSALANCITRALGDRALRDRARERNRAFIRDRANYDVVMQEAESLYRDVIRDYQEGRSKVPN